MKLHAFLLLALVACTDDEPAPAKSDGQVYLCDVSDGARGVLFQVDRCGPADDATPVVEQLEAEISNAGLSYTVVCNGTGRGCDWP